MECREYYCNICEKFESCEQNDWKEHVIKRDKEITKEINENVNKENGLNDKISSYFLKMYIDNHMSKKYPEIMIEPKYFKLYRLTGNIIYSMHLDCCYFFNKFTHEYSKIRLVSKLSIINSIKEKK